MGTLKRMQWRIVTFSSFSVETEDLECDISHISTGMNIEYSDTLITVCFRSFFRWKRHEVTESELKVEGLPQKKHCTPGKKAWRGYYCCVPLCRNSSDQSERERLGLEKLSFHSFPDQKTPLAKEWIARIRRDVGPSFRITKRTKICSVHFNPDDFYHGELIYKQLDDT